jgi:hypothetical protein
MAYQHKIDWSDPSKGSEIVSFTMEPVKTAVLDFHLQVETELGEIINLHFKNPDAFKINRLDFSRKVALVQALIGKTPDDEIWPLVNKLSEFRNAFAHGTPPPEMMQNYADKILEQAQKIRPAFTPTPDMPQGTQVQILYQAMFVIRRFFREIRENVTRSSAP